MLIRRNTRFLGTETVIDQLKSFFTKFWPRILLKYFGNLFEILYSFFLCRIRKFDNEIFYIC